MGAHPWPHPAISSRAVRNLQRPRLASATPPRLPPPPPPRGLLLRRVVTPAASSLCLPPIRPWIEPPRWPATPGLREHGGFSLPSGSRDPAMAPGSLPCAAQPWRPAPSRTPPRHDVWLALPRTAQPWRPPRASWRSRGSLCPVLLLALLPVLVPPQRPQRPRIPTLLTARDRSGLSRRSSLPSSSLRHCPQRPWRRRARASAAT